MTNGVLSLTRARPNHQGRDVSRATDFLILRRDPSDI